MFRILCFGQMAILREGTLLAPGAVQPRRLGLLALLVAARDRAQGRGVRAARRRFNRIRGRIP